MTDWAALQDKAERSTQQIKAELPIAYVMEQWGFPVIDVDPDGRLHCLCPFHADSSPSFDIFGDRWGCYPCNFHGDVLDLIQQREHRTFAAAKATAEGLLAGMPKGWGDAQRAAFKKRSFDYKEALGRVAAATQDDWALSRIAKHYGWPPAKWLRTNWGVGSEWTQVIIPYYDRADQLYTYKRRGIDTHTIAAPGKAIEILYGVWKDTDPDKPVLLCEGESDTWAADYTLGKQYACLGVPGASTPPNVRGLDGRQVVIAFDGDAAGHRARLNWGQSLYAVGCDVAQWEIPDGQDLRQMLYEAPE